MVSSQFLVGSVSAYFGTSTSEAVNFLVFTADGLGGFGMSSRVPTPNPDGATSAFSSGSVVS